MRELNQGGYTDSMRLKNIRRYGDRVNNIAEDMRQQVAKISAEEMQKTANDCAENAPFRTGQMASNFLLTIGRRTSRFRKPFARGKRVLTLSKLAAANRKTADKSLEIAGKGRKFSLNLFAAPYIRRFEKSHPFYRRAVKAGILRLQARLKSVRARDNVTKQ